MKSIYRMFAVVLMGMSAVAFAADPPEQKPAGDEKGPPPPAQDRQEGGRQGGGGGGRGEGREGRGFGRGPGGGGQRGGGMFGRNALDETLATLGDLNLSPDFTLTAEQKQKIQSVRDDFKKAQEKWRADNADAFKKIEDQVTEIRSAGQQASQDEWRQIGEARRKLNETAPNGDDFSKQVLAILTPEQAKQVETKQAAMEKERQEMRERFGGGGFGGGPGGGGGRRGGGGGERQGGSGDNNNNRRGEF